VPRLPRRPLARRLAALAVGTTLFAAVGVAATAGSASADTVLNVHYALTGTTFHPQLRSRLHGRRRRPHLRQLHDPALRHCGLSTLLLNLTIPGSGNTLNLTLGQLQLG
jgi:hypothetical protein